MAVRESLPVDAAAVRGLLERFMELGERHHFRFTDGRAFEGWLVEVGEDAVLVMNDADEERTIPFAEIDLGTLRYIENGELVPFGAT